MAEKITFLILSGAAVCFLFHRLIYSQKKVKLIWALLIFAGILGIIYVFNPNNRIYSVHGFIHAGIVYQILNGVIPPTEPLMAGKTMLYPWGFEFVAALITNIFNVTPFISFAVLNIASLVIAMFLIHKISRLLIKDDRANILSVIISLFGITVLEIYLLALLRKLGIFAEWRGVPVFNKFSNVNGLPLGLAWFLLYLYSAINIFTWKKPKLNAVLFLISILMGGFVYPQFLPCIIAATICLCLINVAVSKKEERTFYLRRSGFIIVLLIISALILAPYFSSISSGVGRKIQLFNLGYLFKNAVNYFVVAFPVLLLIFINREFLWKHLSKQVFINIITVVAATFACYISIHMPFANEYKALILSTVTLGILAGISLSSMRQWCNKTVIFIILLILILPAFENIYVKLRLLENFPIKYVEKGRYIYSENKEENELYKWIRKETNTDDIFVDSEPTLPVLAQRPLFVALDKRIKGRIIIYPGYSLMFGSFFQSICGYDARLVRKRNNIVRTLYTSNRQLSSVQKEELLSSNNNIYLIVRKARFRQLIEPRGFVQVFRSSRGNFLVYQCAMKRPGGI